MLTIKNAQPVEEGTEKVYFLLKVHTFRQKTKILFCVKYLIINILKKAESLKLPAFFMKIDSIWTFSVPSIVLRGIFCNLA